MNIDGSDLTDKLKENSNKDYLGLEKILLESKLPILDFYLKPKTIIYTYFTDKDRIPKKVANYVKSKGLGGVITWMVGNDTSYQLADYVYNGLQK